MNSDLIIVDIASEGSEQEHNHINKTSPHKRTSPHKKHLEQHSSIHNAKQEDKNEIRPQSTANPHSKESDKPQRTKMLVLDVSDSEDDNDFLHQMDSLKPKEDDPQRISNSEIKSSATQKSIKAKNIKNPVQFLHSPLEANTILKMQMKRDRDYLNMFWPQFDLFLSDDGKYLMSAKKKSGNTTSNYYIGVSQAKADEVGSHYAGKVRANFSGTIYNIFDQGINPQKQSEEKDQKVRHLLASVIYHEETKVTTRCFSVYAIKKPYQYSDLDGISIKSEEKNLMELYSMGDNSQKIQVLNNRLPTWSHKLNGYFLSFEGRATQPSIKNFILEDDHKQEVIMFGKIGEDCFNIEISAPLSPHVALGVVLSSFEYKLTGN